MHSHLPAPSTSTEEIRGRFTRILFRHEDTGRTFALFQPAGERKAIAVAGYFTTEDLSAREIILQGRWVRERHGRLVFQVPRGAVWRGPHLFHEIPPLEGIERLCVVLFRGRRFGPAAVKKLVASLGPHTWEALTREPYVLAEHVGGVDRAIELHNVFVSFGISRAAALAHLMGLGLSFAYARRILEELGTDAIQVLREDPYRMIGVRGIRFNTADRIAQNGFGVAPDDPRRLRALAVSVLEDAAAEGHTSLSVADTLRAIGKRVDLAPAGVTELDLLTQAVREGVLVEDMGDVYLPYMHEAEHRAALGLVRMLSRPARRLPAGAESDPGLASYTEEQQRAIRLGLTSPVALIVGKPGTGKTTVVREIVRLARRYDIPVTLTATTSRAADRLNEALRSLGPATSAEDFALTDESMRIAPAKTIHSVAGNRAPGRPLPSGIVVIDEFGMTDLPLLARIVENAGPNTTLVLIGDPNQLPPIIAGNASRDLRDSAIIPTVELTRVHRQEQATLIAINADRILSGKLPILIDGRHPGLAEPQLRAHLRESDLSASQIRLDSFFVDAGPVETAPNQVLRVLRRLVKRGYDPIRDVQVYTPMHRGHLGTKNLNRLLQQVLNPDGERVRRIGSLRFNVRGVEHVRALRLVRGTEIEVTSPKGVAGHARGARGRVVGVQEDGALDVRFNEQTVRIVPEELTRLAVLIPLEMRVGDPVVQTEHDKKRKLPNGLRGRIIERREGGGLVVQFGERRVEYTAAQARQLQLAYATTVHKGQGGEQPVSVLVAHPSEHAVMLERSLLYVAHTRATEMFVCVGTRMALRMAMNRSRGQARRTRLADRVAKYMNESRKLAEFDFSQPSVLLADRSVELCNKESLPSIASSSVGSSARSVRRPRRIR